MTEKLLKFIHDNKLENTQFEVNWNVLYFYVDLHDKDGDRLRYTFDCKTGESSIRHLCHTHFTFSDLSPQFAMKLRGE